MSAHYRSPLPWSLEALPEAPDLAVLCLPPALLEPAMATLAARGCFAAVVPGAAPDPPPDPAPPQRDPSRNPLRRKK